ncbi:MAG: DEAD/DEAH box helicase [Erysipelotrichaceae bacterium]|nr:DEAD/DEAH box helicase [Erysipelotrichaceae bacterium]
MNFEPHTYQEAAIDWIVEKTHCGLFLPMGMGKTVTTLSAIYELMYDAFEVSKVLVIAPIRVAQSTWPDEIIKWEHTKSLTYALILGNKQKRIQALQENVDIYMINRENVPWLVEYWQDDWPYDMIVIDELSSFKSPQSKRFKALRKVMPLVERFVGLTGTPTPKGLPDLWSQVYLMDQGKRLGKTLTVFRQRYLTPGRRNGHVVYEWELQPDAKQRITTAISDICMSLKMEDWLKLPECSYIERRIKLAKETMGKYKQFERQKILELGEDVITGANAGVICGKLLQFTSGAVYGETHEVSFIHDAKLDALEDLMESANGEPVMVFYYFKHDSERIRKRFSERYNIASIEDSTDIKAWNEGKIDMLLVHPASAGHGLNLQHGGSIIVWFTLPNWNLELYQQANARLHRQGQKNAVRIYHIIVDKTIDEDVIRSLQEKDTTQKNLIESLKAKIKCKE